MMQIADVWRLSPDALSSYLWRRLRIEGPLNPPLDDRSRSEPPEDFLIRAAESGGDDFKDALVIAINSNLRQVAANLCSSETDEVTAEQLASLAFLSTAIGDNRVSHNIYLLTVALFTNGIPANASSESAAIHMLQAIAQLQNVRSLIPFWESFLDRAPSGALRSSAYYGLVKADRDYALARLDRIIRDREVDLPVLAWSLANLDSGIVDLARASRSMLDPLRQILRSALASAGADEIMLRDYDRFSAPGEIQAGFRFEVPDPVNSNQAQFHPRLAA